MSTIVTELLILLVLLLANGVFAMAEIALVSSRKGRLQALADGGSSGAKAALGLMEQPGVFLSTVQVGITLVGTLAGASSGAYLISLLTPVIAGVPYIGHAAEPLSTLLVVSVITCSPVVFASAFSVVFVVRRIGISSSGGSVVGRRIDKGCVDLFAHVFGAGAAWDVLCPDHACGGDLLD